MRCPSRYLFVSALFGAAFVLIYCKADRAPAWPSILEAAGPAPKSERLYVGLADCARCHNGSVPGDIELPGGVKIPLMKEQWVLYKEMPIWSLKDKHAQAYVVLLNDRSKQIGKLLCVAEIHRDRRCLACHTGFPLSQMPVKNGLVDAELEKKFDVNLGVSCEGCHGPAGTGGMDSKGWKDPHQIAPALPYEKTRPWRFLTPHEKQNDFGFYDVRSPSSKTKLCVSCHVGDVEKGRVVTHEMFAAGHPPLPGFELETFTEQMPRHWAEFAAKDAKVQELFLQHSSDPRYKDLQKDNLPRTQALLVGALITCAEYVRLAGQAADPAVRSPVSKPEWPELAVFDCFACHHDLRTPSWRQRPKGAGQVPGRPVLQPWSFALARIAAKTLGTSGPDFDGQIADLRKAVSAQPFGRQKDLVKTASPAAQWLHGQALEREKKPVSRADGLALLKDIVAVASSETLDYDSARQLLWAYQLVDGELKSADPAAKKIKEIMDPLGKKMFLLDLRSGNKAAATISGEKKQRETVEVNLDAVLPPVANYDPSEFRAKLKEIAKLLK
jgi:hypothetical protein